MMHEQRRSAAAMYCNHAFQGFARSVHIAMPVYRHHCLYHLELLAYGNLIAGQLQVLCLQLMLATGQDGVVQASPWH